MSHESAIFSNGDTQDPTDVELWQVFGVCDRVGKGFITREELVELCLTVGISKEDSNVIFEDLDADKDGRITFSEFSQGFKEFLTPERKQVQDQQRRRASIWSISTEISGRQCKQDDGQDQSSKNLVCEDWQRRESVYQAWTSLTSSLVNCNLLSLSPESQAQINLLYRELRCERVNPNVANQVNSTVTTLMKEMETLQLKNKHLQERYNKEKSIHVETLHSLEHEIEDQMTKMKQRERDVHFEREEKRRLQEQMEEEVEEMKEHLKIFQKVDSWLKMDHSAEEVGEVRRKLDDSQNANRDLQMSIQDMKTNVAELRSDLAISRLQFDEKCRELHQERQQALEYMHNFEHLRRQLDLIHEANKRLQDTNDSLRQTMETDHSSTSLSRTSSSRSFCKKNVKDGFKSDETAVNEFGLNRLLLDLDTPTNTVNSEASEPKADKYYLDITEPLSLENNFEITESENVSPKYEFITTKCIQMTFKAEATNPGWGFVEQPTLKQGFSGSFCQSDLDVPTPDRTYKVVLAGDAAVGKSTFIARICKDEFVPNMTSTLGIDYKVKILQIDNKNMAIQLWDTAGQERFRSITTSYFRKADGVLLLYDVTSERSYLNIRKWLQDIEEYCFSSIPVVLCGNKTDLRDELLRKKCLSTIVPTSVGEKTAEGTGMRFFETSTKTGENVLDVIIELARQMAESEELTIQTSALRLFSTGEKNDEQTCCSRSKS